MLGKGSDMFLELYFYSSPQATPPSVELLKTRSDNMCARLAKAKNRDKKKANVE
jgi:hypothetical protein